MGANRPRLGVEISDELYDKLLVLLPRGFRTLVYQKLTEELVKYLEKDPLRVYQLLSGLAEVRFGDGNNYGE